MCILSRCWLVHFAVEYSQVHVAKAAVSMHAVAAQHLQLPALMQTAGQLLFDLGHCIDDKRVQAKGPQQSICCTKSYHGLREFARVEEALQRLVFALWPRLLEVSLSPHCLTCQPGRLATTS